MKLAPLSKLKDHLGIPQSDIEKDNHLNTILDAVSGFIESQTSRSLALETHTVTLSGDGSDSLVLPQYPIQVQANLPIVTSVTLDGVALVVADLDIHAAAGILYRKNGRFSHGRRNIVVVYSAGYKLDHDDAAGNTDAETVPDDLQMAVIRLSARIYERKTAEGVVSVSPSSYSVTYKDGIDDDIKAMISAHTRIRI